MWRRAGGLVGALLLSAPATAGAPQPQEQLVSVQPLVLVVKDFASPEECDQIRELIRKCHGQEWPECHELRSKLHSGQKNSVAGQPDRPRRNSTSFQLSLLGEIDGVIDTIVRRAHVLARHPVTAGEGVQVASYQPGDYYEFHHDSLFRRATLLLYLNDVPVGDGGETIFPLLRGPAAAANATPPLPPAVTGREKENLGFKVERMEPMAPYCQSDFYLKVRPEVGKALLFFSYTPDYAIDHHAVHGACPMVRGEKFTLQRWMRFEPNTLMETSGDAVRHARPLWGRERQLAPAVAPGGAAEPAPELRAEGAARPPARPSRSRALRPPEGLAEGAPGGPPEL